MLKAHHRAWLEKHPERSEGWLLQKLGEGFDVHHLDHCHHNNDPANVVLIEHADHMGLHNRVPLRLAKDDPARADLARRAYDMKEPSLSWADVEESVGIVNEKGRHGYAAHIEARRHAFIHGLPWPKPGASVVGGSNKRYQRPPNTTKGQAWRLQSPCTIPNPGLQQLGQPEKRHERDGQGAPGRAASQLRRSPESVGRLHARPDRREPRSLDRGDAASPLLHGALRPHDPQSLLGRGRDFGSAAEDGMSAALLFILAGASLAIPLVGFAIWGTEE